MGSVWRRLGAKVIVLEALPAFLGVADEAVAKEAQKVFAKQGLAIRLGVNITKVTVGGDDVVVEWNDADGKSESATFDRLIVSIGRLPHTAGLNAAAVGTRARRARLRRRRLPTAGPISPTYGRSATSSAVRCSHTRPRTKVSPLPSVSPASTAMSISTRFRG